MRSFRRLALMLALFLPAVHAVLAQSSSSNPPPPVLAQAHNPLPPQNPNAPAPDQAQPQQPEQPQAETPQQLSVQARIRARREQRRAAAIHDAYAHRFDTFADMGYLRFRPGTYIQRLTFYGWETGITRYYSERLGINVVGRGYYGTAYVGLNPSNITRPAISQYDVLAGPTYRFYLQPKYSISGRVMGGYSYGNFSGDTNGFGGKTLGLYPDGNTFAVSASAIGEYNLAPNIGFRLGGEYFMTGYGSTIQNSLGFTGGIVYRFGKQ
ncbi:MAG: hypothetical protein WA802_12230 [Terracidiphilus sp.]